MNMIKKKRFEEVYGGVKDNRTGRTLSFPIDVVFKLNEINGLYDCVFDRNEKLEKENEKLNKHVHSIIQLLDGVIEANEYEIEWATENNKDCSCIKYVNEEFEKIKRRLEEMQ